MAKRKKMTGFSRLIIALIILVPSAFVGASYINGEDPVQNFKELMGWEQPSNNNSGASSTQTSSEGRSNNSGGQTSGSTNNSPEYLKHLEQKIAVLEEQLARCQASAVD